MKNPKIYVFRITLLFLVSWLALAIMSSFYILSRIQNLNLKNKIAILQQSLTSLNESVKKISKEKDMGEERVLDFLEWQFVLKDQVAQANQRFLDRINKIKDLKKDKSLLNLLYANLGLSYTLALDFDSAIKAFEEAVKFDAQDAYSFYNLGLLYSARANPKKAVKYYKKYLELVPSGAPRAEEVKERIKNLEGKNEK
jgi:tetratricopeptide (TPR) repeat protein